MGKHDNSSSTTYKAGFASPELKQALKKGREPISYIQEISPAFGYCNGEMFKAACAALSSKLRPEDTWTCVMGDRIYGYTHAGLYEIDETESLELCEKNLGSAWQTRNEETIKAYFNEQKSTSSNSKEEENFTGTKKLKTGKYLNWSKTTTITNNSLSKEPRSHKFLIDDEPLTLDISSVEAFTNSLLKLEGNRLSNDIMDAALNFTIVHKKLDSESKNNIEEWAKEALKCNILTKKSEKYDENAFVRINLNVFEQSKKFIAHKIAQFVLYAATLPGSVYFVYPSNKNKLSLMVINIMKTVYNLYTKKELGFVDIQFSPINKAPSLSTPKSNLLKSAKEPKSNKTSVDYLDSSPGSSFSSIDTPPPSSDEKRSAVVSSQCSSDSSSSFGLTQSPELNENSPLKKVQDVLKSQEPSKASISISESYISIQPVSNNPISFLSSPPKIAKEVPSKVSLEDSLKLAYFSELIFNLQIAGEKNNVDTSALIFELTRKFINELTSSKINSLSTTHKHTPYPQQ